MTTPLESRIVDGRVLYAPPTEAEGTARQLYAHPDQTDTLMESLGSRFDRYCDVAGLSGDDLAVRHKRNRTLYKAVGAPLLHEVELAADRRFLDAHKHSLDLSIYTDGLALDHKSQFPFEGQYANYVAVEAAVNLKATTDVLDELFADDRHYLRPIWEAYADVLPKFAITERQMREHVRPLDPIEDLKRTVTSLGEETMLPFLMQFALRYKQKRQLSAGELTYLLLARSEEISWASTLSRHVRIKTFPDAGANGAAPDCPYALHAQRAISDTQWGQTAWNRPDTANGPRQSAGFCPVSSTVELSPRTAEDGLTVERVLALRNVPRIILSEPGVGCGAELHIIRSIKLLGQTVFQAL